MIDLNEIATALGGKANKVNDDCWIVIEPGHFESRVITALVNKGYTSVCADSVYLSQSLRTKYVLTNIEK